MCQMNNRNSEPQRPALRSKTKRHLIVFLTLAFLGSLAFVFDLPAARSEASGLNADDAVETLREQELALEAEMGPKMFEYVPDKTRGEIEIFGLGTVKPLFIGVDDVAIPAFLVDPADASTQPAFTGNQIWGAAYDRTNNRVFFNNGSQLWQWPVGGTPTLLGPIVDGAGAAQSMVSLAWHNGQLYGTKNISTEAIWQIDPVTRVATILITYPTTHDMGGFAVDPNTGLFYATDDGSTDSLVRINNDGTVTPIAPYPTGETDIDGLAISDDGRAYLVTDQPGNIYVYDLVGGAYLPPFVNPWITSETFSGAAWIQQSASTASVSGRAVTPSGDAIANVVVQLTDGASFSALARSSPFGYFRFEGVPTGATYTLTGSRKQHSFSPMNVPVNGDVSDIVLTSDAFSQQR